MLFRYFLQPLIIEFFQVPSLPANPLLWNDHLDRACYVIVVTHVTIVKYLPSLHQWSCSWRCQGEINNRPCFSGCVALKFSTSVNNHHLVSCCEFQEDFATFHQFCFLPVRRFAIEISSDYIILCRFTLIFFQIVQFRGRCKSE